jgi:hypothetical protein
MSWTATDHADATVATRELLAGRPEADLAPRTVEALAVELHGDDQIPRAPRSAAALSRLLRSKRFGRWQSVTWRLVLAATLADSTARKEALRSDDPLGALEAAGFGTAQERRDRADRLRERNRP